MATLRILAAKTTIAHHNRNEWNVCCTWTAAAEQVGRLGEVCTAISWTSWQVFAAARVVFCCSQVSGPLHCAMGREGITDQISCPWQFCVIVTKTTDNWLPLSLQPLYCSTSWNRAFLERRAHRKPFSTTFDLDNHHHRGQLIITLSKAPSEWLSRRASACPFVSANWPLMCDYNTDWLLWMALRCCSYCCWPGTLKYWLEILFFVIFFNDFSLVRISKHMYA